MRVILDANILISSLLSANKQVRQILRAVAEEKLTLIVPEELFYELRHKVNTKPYLAGRITGAELEELVRLLDVIGERMPLNVTPVPMVEPNDPKDSYLVAYALLWEVDCLVTGDKGLLALAPKIPKLMLLTLRQFVEQFQHHPNSF